MSVPNSGKMLPPTVYWNVLLRRYEIWSLGQLVVIFEEQRASKVGARPNGAGLEMLTRAGLVVHH